MYVMKIKDKILEIRYSLGVSQRVLAELLGVETVTISSYERGVRKPCMDSLIKLMKLCSKHKIPLELLEIEDIHDPHG